MALFYGRFLGFYGVNLPKNIRLSLQVVRRKQQPIYHFLRKIKHYGKFYRKLIILCVFLLFCLAWRGIMGGSANFFCEFWRLIWAVVIDQFAK